MYEHLTFEPLFYMHALHKEKFNVYVVTVTQYGCPFVRTENTSKCTFVLCYYNNHKKMAYRTRNVPEKVKRYVALSKKMYVFTLASTCRHGEWGGGGGMFIVKESLQGISVKLEITTR